MKRRILNKASLKKTALAVPAAALMLGAAQAGSSVGINFWGNYANYNYGFGPVTATAFGLAPADWTTTPGGDYIAAATGSMSAGALTVYWSAPNTWISTAEGDPNASNGAWNTPLPGNPEVLWGYLDDGNASVQAPAASVSGLSSMFPNGYVIQTLAANEANPVTFANVNVFNAITTNTLVYSSYYHTYDWYGPVNGANKATWAMSPQSAVFTDDTISLQCDLKGTTGVRSVLCGFIITDKPVVSQKPVGGSYDQGDSFTLTAQAIGIGTLGYQWQKNGTNIDGATTTSYAVPSALPSDGGSYTLVATNAYGAGTSVVASVTVYGPPTILTDVQSATAYQTLSHLFTAGASGKPPLSYQWTHAGTNLPGATTTSLLLNNLQAADAGSYQVIITNTLGAATSSVATLALIAGLPYEGFDYADTGDVTGQNGGTGWGGAWTDPNSGTNGLNAVVHPTSTYQDLTNKLVVNGGTLQMAASGTADYVSVRPLAGTVGGAGTVYLSFIGQFVNSGWEGIWLRQGSADKLFIGQGWLDSPWGFGSFPYPENQSSKASTVLSFVVCRFDFTATNTQVRMYVNPALAVEPTSADASGTWSVFQFDTLRLAAHNYPGPTPNGVMDELRIGGTWASVTPNVPRTDPPVIVQDLAGVTTYAYAGGSATMSIVADGAPTLHYQWNKGATPVGSDSPTLTLTSMTTGDNGDYYVTVTNPYGTTNSMTNHLTVVASPDLYTSQVIPDSPGSYWPLNEAVAPTAYDYAGGKDGTQNGGLTLGVAGPRPPAYQGFSSGKTAYQFDGWSSSVDCGTGPALSGTTDFTLEAWINTTNTAGAYVLQQRSGYDGEYVLRVTGSGRVFFLIFGGGGYQYEFGSPVTGRRVNDGSWHHIAAVRSGTNGVIYIDGGAVATASGTLRPLDPTFPVAIGKDLRDNGSYFNGLICDVAIYSYALSGSRIAAHASTGVLGTSPLKLNLVAGGWVEDSKPVGQPYDGMNLGASWVASSTDANTVARTGVAKFSSGAQIAVPANADFDSPTGTVCFWMRTGIPAAGTGTILFDRRASGNGLLFVLNGTPTGAIDVQYTGGASFATGSYVVDDNWHHVAVTFDQSASGAVTVYVDGSNVGSQLNTAAWSWTATQQIELGRSHDTYWQEYNGQMDDFRIYNRILTDTEIATIATPATSDTLIDTGALKVRYNFGTAAGVGTQLTWPIGVLQGAPALGSPTTWTPVNTTTSSYPLLPPYPVTTPAMFYELKLP